MLLLYHVRRILRLMDDDNKHEANDVAIIIAILCDQEMIPILCTYHNYILLIETSPINLISNSKP